MEIRTYRDSDQDKVVALWRDCGLVVSWNDPVADISRKIKVDPELLLVGEIAGEIIATVMGGYEGHRGWINYLAVAPEYRKKGFGRRVMDEVEKRIKDRGCPKINLQVRTDNQNVIKFYQSLGYGADDVVSLGKRLVEDE